MSDELQKPVVFVDLDGVLNNFDGWRSPEFFHQVRHGAHEFLAKLNEAGFDIIVFTVRYAPWAEEWLAENGLSDMVKAVTDRKSPAHVYLDDRAVCFQGDFSQAFQQIIDFRAHWEGVLPPVEDAGLSNRSPA